MIWVLGLAITACQLKCLNILTKFSAWIKAYCPQTFLHSMNYIKSCFPYTVKVVT